jgi:hypothetical protein
VWKATTSVGCGQTEYSGLQESDAINYFVVCQYYPPGNYDTSGEFHDNVGPLVSSRMSMGAPNPTAGSSQSQPTTSSGNKPISNQGSSGNGNGG